MNVFFKELKSYRWSLLFWSIGMVALVSSSLAKFASYSTSGESVKLLLDQLPHTMQVIFGLTGFDLDKVTGYIGVTFMYVALMAAVHAVLLGAGIIAKEERDKTSEFLMSKPVARSKIISAKIMAGIFNVLVVNAVTLWSLIYFADYFSKGNSTNNYAFLLMIGLLFLQVIFFFIGTAVAAISRRPKTSVMAATSVMLVTFIMTYFIDFNSSLDKLKYFTPFRYFDARVILSSDRLDLGYILLSSALISALVLATYVFYSRRDLSV